MLYDLAVAEAEAALTEFPDGDFVAVDVLAEGRAGLFATVGAVAPDDTVLAHDGGRMFGLWLCVGNSREYWMIAGDVTGGHTFITAVRGTIL